MDYETVIGIEIHCELKTKTKMFSSAPCLFDEEPNSCTNEIDLALPGTLPCVNKEAVRLSLMACMALNCEIDSLVKFDRKNYYYPDLPKGYQITQQFHPLGRKGYIEIEPEGIKKKIRINRIHMEEDTAKQFHQGEFSFLDFNRAGTPLIEIVSEADMRSGLEASLYVSELRNILYYLGISDGKMEEGSLRCDTNVSVRKKGETEFGIKTEIKNLNSIANIEKAIDYEAKRQIELIESGKKVIQATMRFDEKTNTTVMMRSKEGTIDYKFFPEPNIPPIRLDENWINDIKNNLSELPSERKERYLNEYGLSQYQCDVLVNNKELSDFYEETLEYSDNYKQIADYLISEITGYLNNHKITVNQSDLKPGDLAGLCDLINKNTISGKQAKELLPQVMEGNNPLELVKEKGMSQLSDENELEIIIKDVLDNNAQSINDYKNGKDRAFAYLVGQVMKATKGKANPQLTNEILRREIDKR